MLNKISSVFCSLCEVSYLFLNQAHRDLAREAVRKSLVLLKNRENLDPPLIPLPKKANKILVAGTHANNLGYQCGGWTITWQGLEGNNLTTGMLINPPLISCLCKHQQL